MSESPPRGDARTLWAWSLYDFANSAFTTLVITFIYATFFVKGIAESETAGTVWWTWGVLTPSAALVALLSPLLGALADRTGTRKRALMITTVVCVGATALLFVPQRGDVVMAVILVAIANIAFEMGQVFYNAFLPEIDEMEATLRGMHAEIGNPDDILAPDRVTHPRQLAAGEPDQFAVAQGGSANLRGGAQRQRGDCASGQPGLDKIAAFHRFTL